MVLSVQKDLELSFVHYGLKAGSPGQFLSYRSYRRGDYGTEQPAYPARGGRHFNCSALAVTYPGGGMNTELDYVSHSAREVSDGVSRTEVRLADPKTGLEVALFYDAYRNEDVIVCHAEITNTGKKPVELESYASPAINVYSSDYLLTHFHGGWAREMQVCHERLTPGIKTVRSMKGVRTTHTENPSFMLSLGTDTFNEDYGDVIAGALAWSGNYNIDFQIDETNRLCVVPGGFAPGEDYVLKAGKTFSTPEMIYTFSHEGVGQASRNLHSWARKYWLYDASVICPTLLNNWEGTYFKFNEDILKGIIDNVAEMGLEMFVLDDGWFGGKDFPRNSSSQGLGDWQVVEEKLPGGVSAVADYAHSKGLRFGIWIEPEMVNPKSRLAQKHPDWIVKEKGREVTTIRNQWLLDLTNPEVQDFVFGVFDSTMGLAEGIDYIKWDCNRHVESAGSSTLGEDQSNFWVDYTQGLYSVYRRVREKYPDVIVQSCASGGGRMDYGALHFCNEAWTSDNTEALSRIFIQYGTNLIYPSIVCGSHVSAVPNHQTGNITPLKFRFDVACAQRLGMELQPASMTEDEKAFSKRAIESFKSYRDIVYYGDLYRLGSPYGNDCYGLMYVSPDKSRAVVFAYTLRYLDRNRKPSYHLRGLSSDKVYRVRELNVDKSCYWGNGKSFSGSFLMNFGLNPEMPTIYSSAVFLLEAE
ncbi:MAG: alpha-galactosidase [Candidatus Cryptobacteroides sp.]